MINSRYANIDPGWTGVLDRQPVVATKRGLRNDQIKKQIELLRFEYLISSVERPILTEELTTRNDIIVIQ